MPTTSHPVVPDKRLLVYGQQLPHLTWKGLVRPLPQCTNCRETHDVEWTIPTAAVFESTLYHDVVKNKLG